MPTNSKTSFMNLIKNYDAYPKTLEDFQVKTFTGAAGNLFYWISYIFYNDYFIQKIMQWKLDFIRI